MTSCISCHDDDDHNDHDDHDVHANHHDDHANHCDDDDTWSGVTTGCHFPAHCRLLLGFQHQAILPGDLDFALRLGFRFRFNPQI